MEEKTYSVYMHVSPSKKVYIGITKEPQNIGGITVVLIQTTFALQTLSKSMVGIIFNT